ncbi:MAG: hypothetical protein GYA62_06385, partial [Bacteroidales bacterium]|nr:hypothetical protein [Bacteroidales bacterium]
STVTATSVTFSDKLDQTVATEVTQKLNSIYQTVNSTTSKNPAYDIIVVIGLRKGATPKPSSSPSATPAQ